MLVTPLSVCPQCGGPMPPPKATGRKRIYCSDACKVAARQYRETYGWTNSTAVAAPTTDPVTRRRRMYEQFAELVDRRPAAEPHEQLGVVALEASQLAFAARRLASQVPDRLKVPAHEMAEALTAADEIFRTFLENA